ncbi:MAG: hypothetical protein AAB590_01035 [Patescibacteria group bacterium]
MIRGYFDNNRPHIPLTIGWGPSVEDTFVLVDTGFNGEIKITPENAKRLELNITHDETVGLANGQRVSMSAALIYVDMGGSIGVVNAIIAPGDTVIGVNLMKKFACLLTANFKTSTLRLKPQPAKRTS